MGVSRTADTPEIKRAYHKLARQFHPDHNGGHPLSAQRFRLIAEAYDVLGDSEKRSKYDRFGTAGLVLGQEKAGLVAGMERFVTSLSDMVEARVKRQPQQGQNYRTEAFVSFKEACLGCSVEVIVPQHVQCADCEGKGAREGSSIDTCHVCSGTGEFKEEGLLAVAEPCSFCLGSGRIAVAPCVTCDGEGKRLEHLPISIEIPALVEQDRRLVLRGFGEPGKNGAEPGDLFVTVKTSTHPILTRDGYDLHCTVPITIREAVLGAEVDVPTLGEAPVRIKLPRGSTNGQQLRLKGRGLARAGGAVGDVYVHLELETPVLNSKAGAAILDKLDSHASYPRREDYENKLRLENE